ncbi:MAG TPA: AraC family transcriptional regulator [Kofleriaceae bacterium]|jgi:AraC-like DNA-binding protein|nr:AraC family transcriptional regulator [Kofleriaceae bacterium]
MRRVDSPDDLARDPLDHYWLGKRQIVYCRSATVCGSLHWGTPDTSDMKELARALELARHPALGGGFAVFMDSSTLERVDWEPFSELAKYVATRLTEWAKVITKQAVVIPAGPAGALVAGMVPMMGMAYPMRFFSDTGEALTWLGWARDPVATEALDEARTLAAEARGVTPTIHQLRAWLATDLIGPTLDSAARALSVSSRTLQRELQTASTSFTAEVQAARVRAASAMLAETDEKIEVIARSVGCGTASQLSTLFKKLVGETPARYRERLAEARNAKPGSGS